MKHKLKTMVLIICSLALQMSSKITLKKENGIFILGNTEQTILEFIEDIANKSMPIDKVTNSVLQGGGRSFQRCSHWLCSLHKWSKKCKYWLKQSVMSVCMHHLIASCLHLIIIIAYFTSGINKWMCGTNKILDKYILTYMQLYSNFVSR